MTTGAAMVSGHTPDGRRLTVIVPYVEVPGFPSAAPVDEAWRLARERLDQRLAEVAETEQRTGLWVCCDAAVFGDHAPECAAAWPDGTPR